VDGIKELKREGLSIRAIGRPSHEPQEKPAVHTPCKSTASSSYPMSPFCSAALAPFYSALDIVNWRADPSKSFEPMPLR